MKPEVRMIDEREAASVEVPGDDGVEVGLEVPEADAAEQHRSTTPGEESDGLDELPGEADPADVADQRRAVPGSDDYDEDDYA